jgi:hypothetical protein
MENPANWDRLTSSLAVCDLQMPDKVWAFLVLQGLVRDLPGDRDFFYGIIHRERAVGEITGPSLQSRISGRLRKFGIALSLSEEVDPHAQTAKKRLESLNYLMRDKQPFQAVRKSVFCTHCGAQVENPPAVCPACGNAFHDFSETCIKPCERCQIMNPMSARFCCSCGNRFEGSKDSPYINDQPSKLQPNVVNPSPSQNTFQQPQKFCSNCGGLNNPGYKFCRKCGANSNQTIFADERKMPDKAQLPGYWEARMFTLYLAAEKDKELGDLLSVLVSTIQDMVVIKQMLAEKGIWDEELYKKLRTERMIGDHSGAGASPWTSYSHFPYTLDEEEFLKHMFNASEEEIEEFKNKVETVSRLT